MADDGLEQEQTPEPQAPEAQPEDGGKPEPDWKAQARKWEERAKANSGAAKKLAEIEAANQTAQERAEARATAAEAKAAAAAESIASARLEAALTGLVADPAEEVADLNIRKFLGDDGEIDLEKVAALRQRYAARVPQGPRAPRPNPAQGLSQPPKTLAEQVAEAERGSDGSRQSTRDVMRLKSRQLAQVRNQQG